MLKGAKGECKKADQGGILLFILTHDEHKHSKRSEAYIMARTI